MARDRSSIIEREPGARDGVAAPVGTDGVSRG